MVSANMICTLASNQQLKMTLCRLSEAEEATQPVKSRSSLRGHKEIRSSLRHSRGYKAAGAVAMRFSGRREMKNCHVGRDDRQLICN